MKNNQKAINSLSFGEIDLSALLKYLRSRQKIIFQNLIIGGIIGVIIAFSIPKEYKTVVKIAPENIGASGQMAGMGALAAIAGINVSNSGVDGITPSLFPEIISSTPFLLELKDIRVKSIQGSEFTIYNYLCDNQKESWWFYVLRLPGKIIGYIKSLSNPKAISSNQSETWNHFWLTEKQQNYINLLSSKIEVRQGKGVIDISVVMQDPVISATIADSVVAKLQEYMINYKTEKSRNDLNYTLKLFKESQNTYYSLQNELAKYEDANKNVSSAKYLVEKERLLSDVSLAYSVYSSLSQQVETLKAKVQQDTPVVTILEPARVSVIPIFPNKKVLVFMFIMLSFIFTSGYYTVRYLTKTLNKSSEKSN